MANHNDLGEIGEEIAEHFLQDQGYEILERNWRWGHAEIDLIAKNEDVLVFVEVKLRAYNIFGFPEDNVSNQKEKLLYEAASEYIYQLSYSSEIRFDIISIILNPKFSVVHFKDAFFPVW